MQILEQLKLKKKYYHYKEQQIFGTLEWKERQTKRVINMQKVYEFLI